MILHKKTKAQQTLYKNKNHTPEQTPRMPTLHIQERANKSVCKPQADSEERAIPPDGLNEFSLGQCFPE